MSLWGTSLCFVQDGSAATEPIRLRCGSKFVSKLSSLANLWRRRRRSRGMAVDAMQEVAQGRVWSGRDALSVGLVDAIGGVNTAVAIAKQAAGLSARLRPPAVLVAPVTVPKF